MLGPDYFYSSRCYSQSFLKELRCVVTSGSPGPSIIIYTIGKDNYNSKGIIMNYIAESPKEIIINYYIELLAASHYLFHFILLISHIIYPSYFLFLTTYLTPHTSHTTYLTPFISHHTPHTLPTSHHSSHTTHLAHYLPHTIHLTLPISHHSPHTIHLSRLVSYHSTYLMPLIKLPLIS